MVTQPPLDDFTIYNLNLHLIEVLRHEITEIDVVDTGVSAHLDTELINVAKFSAEDWIENWNFFETFLKWPVLWELYSAACSSKFLFDYDVDAAVTSCSN
jgi:hypothetical protein